MTIKPKSCFDNQEIRLPSGERIKIPSLIYAQMKKLIRINGFLSKHNASKKSFGLGMGFNLLFYPPTIKTKTSLQNIKSQLTYNQKKAIKDLREKDCVVKYAKSQNETYAQLSKELQDFCGQIPSLDDVSKSTKDGNVTRLFRLSQMYGTKIYQNHLQNKKPFNCFNAQTTEYNDFLGSDYWLNVKASILTRDDWHCQGCGASFVNRHLHIHHKTYENHMDEKNNLGDLITLCEYCHGQVHKRTPMRRYIPERYRKNIPGTEPLLLIDLD